MTPETFAVLDTIRACASAVSWDKGVNFLSHRGSFKLTRLGGEDDQVFSYSYFGTGCRKKKCVRHNPETGNIGYDQYTAPDTVAVKPTFVASALISTSKHTSMASRTINFQISLKNSELLQTNQ